MSAMSRNKVPLPASANRPCRTCAFYHEDDSCNDDDCGEITCLVWIQDIGADDPGCTEWRAR